MDNEDDEDNEDGEDNEDEPKDANNGFKLYSKGEYNKNREKNIAELKLIVTDLKNKHPIPTDCAPKPPVKKAARKKKSDDKPVKRRVSMRNKAIDKLDGYVILPRHVISSLTFL